MLLLTCIALLLQFSCPDAWRLSSSLFKSRITSSNSAKGKSSELSAQNQGNIRQYIMDHFQTNSPSAHLSTAFWTLFANDYLNSSCVNNMSTADKESLLGHYLNVTYSASKMNITFERFHEADTTLRDWSVSFYKSLVDVENSELICGDMTLEKLNNMSLNNENVILLSNQQTDADPYILSIMLESYGFKSLAEKIIYIVDPDRLSDPASYPFLMGQNFVPFHVKNRFSYPIDQSREKRAYNTESAGALFSKFMDQGNIVWMSPSRLLDFESVFLDNAKKMKTLDDYCPAAMDYKELDRFKVYHMMSPQGLHFVPVIMHTKALLNNDMIQQYQRRAMASRSGAVKISILNECSDIGMLDDRTFCTKLQKVVDKAYGDLLERD